MSIAIQISNLSKIYRLGELGTGTISHDLERWYKMRIRGQEDPFLKIGETNNREKKGATDIVYSLKDVNFTVPQGEALGIIGKNGAGKSTLLKIISRVTSPTTGEIKIKGRIASLLEVGTGFHPELTGRENIYLNGAILGMRKREITRKLDEIIDFSGVERYIDTPVKRYSSGMYVRLAFAVAAHLESEILIVDEVLAVGDADFQKKCLGKMGAISKGEGRTVLFVSHNMHAIQNLCSTSLLMESGTVSAIDKTDTIIDKYLDTSFNRREGGLYKFNYSGVEAFNFCTAETLTQNGVRQTFFRSDEDIIIRVTYEIRDILKATTLVVNIGSKENFSLWAQSDGDIHNELFDRRTPGLWQSEWIVPRNTLKPGIFTVALGGAMGKTFLHHPDMFSFEITPEGFWKKSAELFGVGGGPIAARMEVTKPKLVS